MKSPFFVNSFISLVFFTLLCASNQYSFYWIYAKSLFYKFIDMRYSVIIPVYNRPDEVDELLQSLTVQCFKDFEVVIGVVRLPFRHRSLFSQPFPVAQCVRRSG